jgi:hypothetical protein
VCLLYKPAKSLILKYVCIENIKNTPNSSNNEWIGVIKNTNATDLIQIKYIGYYTDLEISNPNKHYTYNWHRGLHYYKILELFDHVFADNINDTILINVGKVSPIIDNDIKTYAKYGMINEYRNILVINNWKVFDTIQNTRKMLIVLCHNDYWIMSIQHKNAVVAYAIKSEAYAPILRDDVVDKIVII